MSPISAAADAIFTTVAGASLDLLVPPALAQGAPPASGGDALLSLLPLIGIFAVFYFLMIRPQQKKVKEHKKMVEALSKGDEVITSGGILGRITNVGANFVRVEVSQDKELRIQRHAIANVMPKGTIKDADKSD